MSGSLESVRWNACVHRLDLGLYSHPKEFLGNGVRTYATSKGKNSPQIEPTTLHQAGQPAQHTTNQQDSQPNTLPTSYSGPHQAGQPAQHTTNQLFRPPSSRTASPTHYQPAIPAPEWLMNRDSPATRCSLFRGRTWSCG